MALLDSLNILAAVIYGSCLAGTKPEKKPEGGGEKKDAAVPEEQPIPKSWATATDKEQEACLDAVRFLRRFIHTAPLDAVDRDVTAMALASQMKGSALADLKPNYRQVVDMFICGAQVNDTE